MPRQIRDYLALKDGLWNLGLELEHFKKNMREESSRELQARMNSVINWAEAIKSTLDLEVK